MQEKTTHFGYQDVAWHEKAEKVAGVFHSVASSYDMMNDLMSLGIHRLWKRFALSISYVRPGEQVLDLAAGTGDLTSRFAQKVGPKGLVISSDINASMLQGGRDRLLDDGIHQNVRFVQADAQALPFPNNRFHCISIGFGLRNVTDKMAALRAMYAVLKPGGKVIILEFSKPLLPILQKAYDLYSFAVLPALGAFVADDAESYRYLAESIRMHPDQDTLKQMMQHAQFEDCRYTNLSGGIVAVHCGYKY